MNNYETESLRYLSSQQALADAAQFISYYNATLDNPGPQTCSSCPPWPIVRDVMPWLSSSWLAPRAACQGAEAVVDVLAWV